MRSHLIRGALAFAVALIVAVPAFAQSIVKGTVVDNMGKPIDGATVVIEATDGVARKAETKTNKKGEFLQIGLASGSYKVTATKDKLTQSLPLMVRQGENPPLAFQLAPGSGLSDEERKAQAALGAAAQAAVAAMQAGNDDEAIGKLKEVLAKVPTCSDCYYNLGVAYSRKQAWGDAEAAYRKVLELKPDHADAYSGLAAALNAQKKFDEAVAASAKASQLNAANPAGAASGGNAEALYNQGVILWNAQKYTEAKTQFEAATKADPNMALAHYQLGMASLNLGAVPDAVTAFENYLRLDPNGAKAAEVKGIVSQLKK